LSKLNSMAEMNHPYNLSFHFYESEERKMKSDTNCWLYNLRRSQELEVSLPLQCPVQQAKI
jgi:hypothetical protein